MRLRRRKGLLPRGRGRSQRRRRDDRQRPLGAVKGKEHRDVGRATCESQSAESAKSAQRDADTGAARFHGEPGISTDTGRTDPRGEKSAQSSRSSSDTGALAHPVDRPGPGYSDRSVRTLLRQSGLRAWAEQREAATTGQRQDRHRREKQHGVQLK